MTIEKKSTKPIHTIAVCLFISAAAANSTSAPAIDPSAITATAASEFYPPLTAASLTVDGSGLTGDLHDSHPQGHTMWLSAIGGGGNRANNPAGVNCVTWVLYRFSNPYEFECFWVWNHNQEDLVDRGLRNISVHHSTDGAEWTFHGNIELSQAPGTPDYVHGDEIAMGGVAAQYILISASEVDGNYGSDYYGLSEIRFFGTQLPPTGSVPDDYPVRVLSSGIDPVYSDMLLPQEDGWLGADVAKSIVLSPTRILWLFGDTLIGTVSQGKRNLEAFVNSSIGIQDTTIPPPGNMDFHWGPGDTSFFPHQPGTPGEYYWATSGILLDGELFVFCYSVAPGDGGGLGFSVVGTTLIRIPNPLDPPGQWTQNAVDFGIGGGNLGFHSAFFLEGDYVYFFGYEDTGGRRTVLGRSLAADTIAGATSDRMEFWVEGSGEPEWGNAPENLVTLFEPGVTETDIQYDASLGLYFCVVTDAFTSRCLFLTTATRLTGPWSKPVSVYEVPEYDAVSFPVWHYTGRPHPELSTQPGEIVVTYATNGFLVFNELFTPEGLEIYYPRFVRLQVELNLPMSIENWVVY